MRVDSVRVRLDIVPHGSFAEPSNVIGQLLVSATFIRDMFSATRQKASCSTMRGRLDLSVRCKTTSQDISIDDIFDFIDFHPPKPHPRPPVSSLRSRRF
jgi:hypothetical protein